MSWLNLGATGRPPLVDGVDVTETADLEAQLRWLADVERRERYEARLTYYAVAVIATSAAIGAALRFMGAGA